MSDFLIVFEPGREPDGLLELLRCPYSGLGRRGWTFRFSWGAGAVLGDLIARESNFLKRDNAVAAWVGDCPQARGVVPQMIETLQEEAAGPASGENLVRRMACSKATASLSGSFALVLAGPDAVAAVTDPMAGVQVYAASTRDGRCRAVGTHPDLVAAAADCGADLDPVSVGDFLNAGTPCCPHTMYSRVKELAPASVFAMVSQQEGGARLHTRPWWQPPAEQTDTLPDSVIASQWADAWRAAVEDRCEGRKIGVQLSGGLDSRVVLACIPADRDCAGLTFLDEMNREAVVARDVARAYGRRWQALHRDEEYLAHTALPSIRFTGCEGEWHHAHAVGFAEELTRGGWEDVFTGLFMDNNFKGYYAKDIIARKRLGGLLEPRAVVRRLDYAAAVSRLCHRVLRPDVISSMIVRRRTFAEDHPARGRSSEWEWLDGWPLSQASDNTGWIVERRVMPLRLPVYDRRLVELAFRIPATRKIGGRLFLASARNVLGPGNKVPNANDGVRPQSGAFTQLLQRVCRKTANAARNTQRALGQRTQVPHSWHDYLRVYRDSRIFRTMIREHGERLSRFEGSVFAEPVGPLFSDDSLSWREVYRLVQLSVWLGVIEEYGARARSLRSSRASEPTVYIS